MRFLFKLTHTFWESVCSIKPQSRDSKLEGTQQSDVLWSPPCSYLTCVLSYRDSPGFFASGICFFSFLLCSVNCYSFPENLVQISTFLETFLQSVVILFLYILIVY